jgi:hypothetical protein
MDRRAFVASTLGGDPHTEGLCIAGRIAQSGGIRATLLEPSDDPELLLSTIKEERPGFIGLSYRLTSEVGYGLLRQVLALFRNTGLVPDDGSVRIAFAGLPETVSLVRARMRDLPYPVILMEPHPELIDRITMVVDFFDIRDNREEIISTMRGEIEPPGIGLLDELATAVVARDSYRDEPPLEIPSTEAVGDYVVRMEQAGRPLIRSHFGIPADGIEPTVEGIRTLAEARVLDEISLGSSNLSQRYYGRTDLFAAHQNDGGVPYKTYDDLVKLFRASRAGNSPSVKPYAHVVSLVEFIDDCIRAGMLTGAHQAIPLFWFNELDGRGPTTVPDSIRKHLRAVQELARRGIPVEMNDPNQWGSRWAHDTIIVADYGLISAVMTVSGVKSIILQMQFNKPRETGDYADLAKMTAALDVATRVSAYGTSQPNIYRETRTGIESLSPDAQKAKWQLARSTLLQMTIRPHVVHLVSYCEANHAATPEDIIDSSKLVRRAIRVFGEHWRDIVKELSNPIVVQRREYLASEAEFLLRVIAGLHADCAGMRLQQLASFLADPDVLAESIRRRYMTAPGIVHPEYRNESIVTRPTKYGFIDAVESSRTQRVMSEAERIRGLQGESSAPTDRHILRP